MPRLSVNELTTYQWSFEEDVCHYAEAGISAIGIWRQKLSDYGEEKGVELLRETNLEVSNLLWAGGFTGSDGRSYQESLQDAAAAIRMAGFIGCPTLVLYSGGRGGHTSRHARRLFVSALTALAPIAEEEAVDLAIEPMHPACAEEWTFLTTLESTLKIISEFDHPHVKLAFDTYHLGHESNLVQRIEEFVDRIGIVHLGDGCATPKYEQNRCQLGKGNVPWREIVEALSGAGYDGYYDIELLGEDVEQEDYEQLIRCSKAALEKRFAVPA